MGQTIVGERREHYVATVEARPSRFSNEGRDYRAWAQRADDWAQQQIMGRVAQLQELADFYEWEVEQ